jgi:hypothetical protein
VDSIGVLAETDGWRNPNLREYTVKVVLTGDQDISMLKPSMRAEAEIILGSVEDATAVPLQAVFREGPIAYVYTPKGGRYERTPVALGRRSSTFIEILSGVEDGAQVLLREPAPGEVLDTEFDEKQLATLAGFSMPGAHAFNGSRGRGGMQQKPSGDASEAGGKAPETRKLSKEELDKLLKDAKDSGAVILKEGGDKSVDAEGAAPTDGDDDGKPAAS